MSLSLATRLSLTTATSVLVLGMTTAATADVSAADVWQNLNAPLEGLGMTVSATSSQDGSITTYNDIRYDFTLPMGIGGGSFTSPSVALIENADGTVMVQYTDTMEMAVSGFITGEGSFGATLVFEASESTSLMATGTPGDVTYTGTSGNMSFTLGDITVDGAPFDGLSVTADIQSSGSLSQRIVEGDLVQVTLDMSSDVTVMDMNMTFNDGRDSIVADVKNTNLGNTTHLEMALPAGGSDLLNLAPAFAQGLSMALTSETIGTEQQQTITSDLGIVVSDQTTSSGPSTAAMTLDASGFAIDATVADIIVEMIDPTIPFPVNLDIATASAAYAFPLSASAAPQDFAFALNLDDLRLGTELWDMIDPGKQLDRTPADLNIDLAGTTVLSADVTNFMDFGMRIDMGETVATIEDFELRELELGALGATATATAALTFDNDDWFTYPGMPKPVGGLSFSINGLNAALDQLVAIGAIAQDEVFGMRMMMGMVATASGDDGLSGTIQLGEDGSITANGQRLR